MINQIDKLLSVRVTELKKTQESEVNRFVNIDEYFFVMMETKANSKRNRNVWKTLVLIKSL